MTRRMRTTGFPTGLLGALLVVALTAGRAEAQTATATAAATATTAAAQTATAAAPAPRPPALGFKSHYLVDFATDTVLAASAENERVEPASLTKLMTAYVVFDALHDGRVTLTDKVRVSARAWRMGGTRMFIEVNSDVAVEDLIRGLLIQSGNDAAVALAEHIAGSVEAFAEEMNATAQALGMTSSSFRNPHGLPAREHYTTARDLAVLAKAIIRDFPQSYGLYAEREFSYNGIKQHNRNRLLWQDESVDGMKTGHTNAAGYCLVSSAQRDGMRLIAVVMGADTARRRNEGAKQLLDFGFANFETHKLYSAGQELDAARVRGGEPEYAVLGPATDLYVTIPRGSYGSLAASMDVLAELTPPLDGGATVGEVRVSFDGEPVARTPLVLLKPVADGGVWARWRDEIVEIWE